MAGLGSSDSMQWFRSLVRLLQFHDDLTHSNIQILSTANIIVPKKKLYTFVLKDF